MRKAIIFGIVVAVAVLGLPMGALAAVPQKGGSVTGKAQGSDQAPLRNYTVRVRNARSGEIVGTTMSGSGGDFSFMSLPASDYVIEVVDMTGRVVGVSQTLAIGDGASVNITINATVASALTSARRGGFSFLGLGPVASYTVLTAAGAAAVTGVISSRHDASPSR